MDDDFEFLLNPLDFGRVRKFPFKRNQGLVTCLVGVLRVAKLLVRDTLVAATLCDTLEAELRQPVLNRGGGFLSILRCAEVPRDFEQSPAAGLLILVQGWTNGSS